MANILYKTTGILLSSSLQSVNISTDTDSIGVRLSCGSDILMSERYFAFGNAVSVMELDSLIEIHMRSKDLSYAVFTLDILGENDTVIDSAQYRVVYCDRLNPTTDPAALLRSNFLTTLSVRRIAPDIPLSLPLFAEADENIRYLCSYQYRMKDSTEILHSRFQSVPKTAETTGIYTINETQENILGWCASDLELDDSENIELLSVTFRCGDRSATFFIDSSLSEAETFYFRNIYNVMETAVIPCMTTKKTATDRSVANIAGHARFYDSVTTRTFEVETDALTSDEAEWIDQLFSSHDVRREVDNSFDDTEPSLFASVLITDATCEMKSDGELNTAKFTWRYDSNRPLASIKAPAGIFTEQFDTTFI